MPTLTWTIVQMIDERIQKNLNWEIEEGNLENVGWIV